MRENFKRGFGFTMGCLWALQVMDFAGFVMKKWASSDKKQDKTEHNDDYIELPNRDI